MRAPFVAVLLMIAVTTASFAQDDVLQEGRQRSEAFIRGDVESIWSAMTPEMQGTLGGLDALSTFRDQLERDSGHETGIVREDVQQEGAYRLYLRTANWSKAPGPVLMQWAFDESMKIGGFFVRPAPALAESRFLDYRTKAALRLPFDGEWFVVWGGRTLEQNYHAADRAQRFATDFLVRQEGASHRGDPADLESYHCWDRPILAPAAGTVVSATNDLPDQPIGSSDPENPAGNHVVLDLGNSEFAFLAHFREGSVAVKAGDVVAPGEVIGRCGNSGNTSEPHLHVHLQTTPDLSTGEGLPAYFEAYTVDGEPMDAAEPRQGQTVSPL